MIEEEIKGYKVHEQLGKGAFGVVHRVSREGVRHYQITLKVNYAMKALIIDKEHPEYEVHSEYFEKEIKILSRINYKHIIKYFESFEHEGKKYLVLGWIRGKCFG